MIFESSYGHYWKFDKDDPTIIANLNKDGYKISIEGTVNSVKSPEVRGKGVAIQNSDARIKLNLMASQESCLQDPSSCTSEGLAILMMIKLGSEGEDAMILGADGKLQADKTGIQVVYLDKELTVHINGQKQRCKWKSGFIARHRWFSVAFTWKPKSSNLIVYIDKIKQETGYSCEDHPLPTTTSNSYYLGSFSNLWRYYSLLVIWNKEVSLDTFVAALWTEIEGNRRSTTLHLSLKILGITWNADYLNSLSNRYIQTKTELEAKARPDPDSPGTGQYTKTSVESFNESPVSLEHFLIANIKVKYTQLRWNHAYYLQTAIESLLVNRSHVEIKKCVADDNFFCDTPNLISIETAENPTQLTIRYRPNFTDIVNNNFFESYHFVYNASKVSWINSSDNGYPSVINKTISGLKPYTYYCVRMAASSFKSSGFFTGAKCAWTAESVPTSYPSNLHGYNTSKNTIFISWNPVPAEDCNGQIIGYEIRHGETGSELSSFDTVTIPFRQDNYTFKGLQPFTLYNVTIAAYTIIGKGKRSPAVSIKTAEEVPQVAPSQVEGYNTSSTSIHVTWFPLNKSQVKGILTSYIVRYAPFDDSANVTDNQQVSVPVAETSIELDGLKKYTSYSITVSGVTTDAGLESYPIIVKTSEDIPTSYPSNLHGYNTSKNTIFISWDPVPAEDCNGQIIDYEIQHGLAGSELSSFDTVTIPFTQVNYTFKGLQPFTLYNVTIAAYTIIGKGKRSPAVSIKTAEEVPQLAPSQVQGYNTSSTSIHVTWFPLNKSQVKGILTSYIVRYAPFDDSANVTDNQQVSVPVAETSIELDGLKKYTSYSITVSGATTDAGLESYPIIIKTSEDSPDKAPQIITLDQVSHLSIFIEWELIPRDHINGILRGYLLSYKMTKDDSLPLTKKLHATSTSYVLTNLKAATNYTFSICGLTSVGPGIFSDLKIQTTDEYVPTGFPADFKGENLTSPSTILLSWKPINDDDLNGKLIGYIVLYQQWTEAEETDLESEELALTVQPNASKVAVNNLENFSQYKFRILGYNSKGRGNISHPIYAETCRCSKHLSTSFYIESPYVKSSLLQIPSGIFPPILEAMVQECCKICKNGHGSTHINYLHDGNNATARKNNVTLFKHSDADLVTDLSFPINGFRGKKVHGVNPFVKMVGTPGTTLIVPETNEAKILSQVLLENMKSSLPLLLFVALIIYIIGTLYWLSDVICNPDDPPSFIRGTGEGIWLAFVTITTLGFGDVIPKNWIARIITIVSALFGMCLVSIIVASLSSGLTVSVIETDLKNLYGAKIAALKDSYELTFAVRKGARVTKDYYNVESLRRALQLGEVEGILMDSYVLNSLPHLFDLKERKAKISHVFSDHDVWGVSLAGKSSKLKRCFQSVISFERALVSRNVERFANISNIVGASSRVFDVNSNLYRGLAINGVYAIAAFFIVVFIVRFLFRRSVKKEVESPKKRMVRELRQYVNQFYVDISKRLTEMKIRHQKERYELLLRRRRQQTNS